MANLTSAPAAGGGQSLRATTVQEFGLGTRMVDRFGRVFRYVQAGGSDLVAGNLQQATPQITAHQNCTVAAAAIGATAITVTPGAIAGAANLYAEGLLIVSTTPGLGYVYGISGHPAIPVSTAFVLNLALDDALQVALTAGSKVDLVANPYKNALVCPVALTAAPIGVAVYPIPAGQFGWLQTWGPCGVTIDGTPAVGQALSPSGAVPGALAINATTAPIVGEAMATGVSGRAQAVMLKIAA